MITKTLDFNNIERKFFWILSSVIVVAVAFYLYSALSLTIAVVDREQVNRTAQEISNHVSVLEQEYLLEANKVTLEYAKSLGFRDVAVKFAKDEASHVVAMAR